MCRALYALWTPKAGFTVTYNTNGGSTIANKTVGWDDKVLAGNPTRTGYDFVEWRHDEYKGAGDRYLWCFVRQ